MIVRDRPYLAEHYASRSPRASEPLTFDSLSAWFREEWDASLPTRLHTQGVEPGDVWGAPRWASGFRRRIVNARRDGWGVTGWDREGEPRGVDEEGTTRDRFLFYLEMRLRREEQDAVALVRWAYMGWDVAALAHEMFRRTHGDDDYAAEALAALLERGMRRLWHDCQREPVRFSICRDCRRRECICGSKSESQVNAEAVALSV